MADATQTATLQDMLVDAPRNWGRWGADDEIGALNFLTSAEVLRGVKEVSTGEVFTLGAPVGHPDGDPVWPGPLGRREAHDPGQEPLPRRQAPAAARRPRVRRRLHHRVPAGLDAVRRPRAHLVRRRDLQRPRRRQHHRRHGPVRRGQDRQARRRRPRGAHRHGPPPRQGLARVRRDVRPQRPRGGGQGAGLHDRRPRQPRHPHRLAAACSTSTAPRRSTATPSSSPA